jgi:4-hydroxy-3-methylbut-2-enyl diphosphate reductase
VILAALKQELAPLARAMEGSPVQVIRTGVGPRRAAEAVRRLGHDAQLILSTGCCGGLVPGATAGMLAIPEQVLSLDDDGAVHSAPEPDPELVQMARSICERLGLHCSSRPMITVSTALCTPESKRCCHERSGAVTVEMETAAIARATSERGLPYVAIRVVLDAVNETLPDLPPKNAVGVIRALARPRELVSMASLAIRLRTVSGGLVRCVTAMLEEAGFGEGS